MKIESGQESDQELLAMYVLRGDLRAFESLVARYEERLLRLACSLLHVPSDAEDVVQEGLIALSQHAGTLQANGSERVDGWLTTVVRNKALDRLRQRKPPAENPRAQAQEHKPENALIASENKTALWNSVDRLPELERAVVLLRYREGLDYRAISESLGKTVNHVGVLLHQALARLRRDQVLEAEVVS
jgi:RNA polymerase sigma-70 factor (ECF subfamily)